MRLDGSSNRCSDRPSLVYPIVSCGFTYTLLAIHDVPFLINTEVSSTVRRLWQLRFSLSLPLAAGLPKPLPPQPGSHQASMNRSIFGYGVAARPIEGVGSRMKRGREYRGFAVEGMQSGGGDGGERDDGCELAGVVFPRGKHEHILARGLFRQIGDCCGGERKGSSPHHQHRYHHQSCRRNRTPPCWSNEDRGFSPKFAMEPKRERER